MIVQNCRQEAAREFSRGRDCEAHSSALWHQRFALAADRISHSYGADWKFHSSGREDVDVRMLGSGRPFVLELMDCKRLVV